MISATGWGQIPMQTSMFCLSEQASDVTCKEATKGAGLKSSADSDKAIWLVEGTCCAALPAENTCNNVANCEWTAKVEASGDQAEVPAKCSHKPNASGGSSSDAFTNGPSALVLGATVAAMLAIAK